MVCINNERMLLIVCLSSDINDFYILKMGVLKQNPNPSPDEGPKKPLNYLSIKSKRCHQKIPRLPALKFINPSVCMFLKTKQIIPNLFFKYMNPSSSFIEVDLCADVHWARHASP